jgi:hypothetical protein
MYDPLHAFPTLAQLWQGFTCAMLQVSFQLAGRPGWQVHLRFANLCDAAGGRLRSMTMAFPRCFSFT